MKMPQNSADWSFKFLVQLGKHNTESLKGPMPSAYTFSNSQELLKSEWVLKAHDYFQLLTSIQAAHSSVEYNIIYMSQVHFTGTLILMLLFKNQN